MNRYVEIEPSYSRCKTCNDMAMEYDAIPDCSECPRKCGTWIDTVSNFWGTHAIVLMDGGGVEKIPLDRIKVI